MKKLWPIAILLLGVLITIGVQPFLAPEKKLAEDIVRRIEDFRVKQGRLPANLQEIGMDERLEGPVYYQQESPSEYIVSYGTELGESKKYRSETGKWE